jgi:hypothetical protein
MTGLFKFIPNIVKEKLIKLLKIYSIIANGFWIQIAMYLSSVILSFSRLKMFGIFSLSHFPLT